MSSSMSNFSVSLLILLVIAFLCSSVQASCWRYGHSCWGGHGKRSGGKPALVKAAVALSRGSELKRMPVELPSFRGDGTTAEFISDSPRELSRSKFSSIVMPYASSSSSRTNDGLRDEIGMDSRSEEEEGQQQTGLPGDYQVNSEERLDGQEQQQQDLAVDTAKDTGINSAEIFIGIPRSSSEVAIKPLAIATSEDNMKRAVGDLSSRKFPLENFNLYKLVRVVRRK